MIRKKLGGIALGIVITLIVIGVAAGISVKVAGLPYFMLPVVLGLSALKKMAETSPSP